MSTKDPNTKKKWRQSSFRITSPEQFAVISSATRFDMVEFLSAIGPCSVSELAEHMATRADRLYHHIKKLVATGLVREVGVQRVGRRNESVYDVSAEHFDFDRSVGSEYLLRLQRSINRRSERGFERALDGDLVDFSPESRNVHVRADTGRLTREQLDDILKHIQAIIGIFADGREQRRGDLFTMSLNLMPFQRIHDDEAARD